jgi:hypothetical protein
MVKITVSAVRRPDGQRKGRNGKEVILLGPATVPVPENYPSTHNALASIGPYKFAFWSVTGAAKGPFVTFDLAVVIASGTTDITAKAWYVATVPLAPNGSYVFVDAFDVEKGRFLDDDFVTVKDANAQVNAQLTQAANVNGSVPTGATQLIDAASTLGSEAFDKWVCVTGQEMINATMLTALQGSKAEAIAFYIAGPQEPPGPGGFGLDFAGRFFAEQTWVSWGVTVDGGGPTGKGPVPPWTPLTMQLAAGFALAEAALKLEPRLRAEALKVAARQIASAAESIGKAMAALSDWPPK